MAGYIFSAKQSHFMKFITFASLNPLQLLLVLILTWSNFSCAAQVDFTPLTGDAHSSIVVFVSPNGDDANLGTVDAPLQTVQAARDLAAIYLHQHPRADKPVRIFLRGGRYTQSEPLVFRPEHSGTAEAPIIYAAYRDEAVAISGGREIVGDWRPVAGKDFYVTEVPKQDSENWVFNTLYVNGESRMRARTPNADQKTFRADGRVPGWDWKRSMRFFEGDIEPSWTTLPNADIIFLMTWTGVHHQVDKIDFDLRGLELASPAGQHQLGPRIDFRYYIANLYEGLDAPGEWYLDAEKQLLYYYPLPDERIDYLSVFAPVLTGRLVSFEGDVVGDAPVVHLKFHGIQFMHTDTDRNRWNGVYRQAHGFLDSAIHAVGLLHSEFYRCEIRNVGEHGLTLSKGSQHNLIRQCRIWDTGGGGVQIGIGGGIEAGNSVPEGILEARASVGVTDPYVQDHPRSDVLYNTLENSIIHRVGTYWHGGYGVCLRFASYTQIKHNEIFDTHYTAIASDARWSFDGQNFSRGNEVSYNHLHHIGRRYHSDGAAIYQFGPGDNHYHHNLIHDVFAYPHVNSMKGIYFDQQTQNLIAEKNIIYNIEGVGLNQNWGIQNTYLNNIVAFTEGGATRGRADKPESAFNSLSLRRNVFVSDDGIGLGARWPSTQGEDHVVNNLFYDIHGKELSFWGQSLKEWQASSGLGTGTVLADPGFLDAENLDFTLRSRNSALGQIGFEPFDHEIRKAGLYGDSEWTDLPDRLSSGIRATLPSWTRQELARLGANFEQNFDALNVGDRMPGRFMSSGFNEEEGSNLRVTSKESFSGDQALELIDTPEGSRPWTPSLTLRMSDAEISLKNYRIEFGFAIKLDSADPVEVDTHFREDSRGQIKGPHLRFLPSGEIIASGASLATVEPGTWIQADIVMGQGIKRGSYDLRLRFNDKEETYSLNFDREFDEIESWLLLCSKRHTGKAYVDDLYMRTYIPKP